MTGVTENLLTKETALSKSESPAVAIARAYVEAWSSRDYETARKSLAEDVQPAARLYLLDEECKIKAEQVIFTILAS